MFGEAGVNKLIFINLKMFWPCEMHQDIHVEVLSWHGRAWAGDRHWDPTVGRRYLKPGGCRT